jgi:hypothetical protein
MPKAPPQPKVEVLLRCHDAAVVIAAERTVVTWASQAGVLEKVAAPKSERGTLRIFSNECPLGEDFKGKVHVRRVLLRNLTEDTMEQARSLLLPLSVEASLQQVG